MPPFNDLQPRDNSRITAGHVSHDCSISLTPDMYGDGVRVGFYIQAFTLLAWTLLLPDSSKVSRSVNVPLAASLSVAFFVGAGKSTMGVEYPVFISLITTIMLPTVVEPFFRIGWERDVSFAKRWSNVLQGRGSYVLASLVYAADLCAGGWGLVSRWDSGVNSDCDVKSFLGGSVLRGTGKGIWTAIIWIGFVFGVIYAALGLLTLSLMVRKKFGSQWGYSSVIQQTKTSNEKRKKKGSEVAWIRVRAPGSYYMLAWLVLSLVMIIFAMVTVETSIRMNKVEEPDLRTLGQIIPLISGVGCIVSLIWCLL